MRASPPSERDLVLVGGGHAHVQVIERWQQAPVPGVALTVVLDRAEALYSGMVPGFVAGEFEAHECTIDVLPLVRRAGGSVVLSPATSIDPVARTIGFADRPPLLYDAASLDVGSTVRGLELPGVERFALSTRPIGRFVERVDAEVALLLEAAEARPTGTPLRVVVVGAGAAGVEIACTLHARLGALARRFEWSLLSPTEHPMAQAAPRLRRVVQRALDARGIRFVPHTEVTEVRRGSVCTERGEHPADLVVWATGGAALPVCRDSHALPLDAGGFVRVEDDLRVEGFGTLFAAGDCASFKSRALPKAGVYAVRQGPVLAENLRAVLEARPTRAYRPQRDFLKLLNLGAGRAIGSRNGLAIEGPFMARWKQRIDRRFVARFQVLAAVGRPAAAYAAMMARRGAPERDVDGGAMGVEGGAMECGGCAAKVGPRELEGALASLGSANDDASVRLGLARPDDVAAIALKSGDVLLATVDGFRAFDGDAHLVARIAAQNALTDVYAKGGVPHHALALVTVERGARARTRNRLEQVLSGLRRELDAAGVPLVGGHSTTGPELFVALTVTGGMTGERAPLSLDALRPGDRLVLTKPLGTGVVLAADMRGLAPSRVRDAAITSMLRTTAPASRCMLEHDVAAATDVSGFGLLGHAGELARASGLVAVIDPACVPALPGANALLARGLRSTAHETNLDALRFLDPGCDAAAVPPLLFDPQTSGGLLIGVSAADAERLVHALRASGDAHAAIIGRAEAGTGSIRLEPSGH